MRRKLADTAAVRNGSFSVRSLAAVVGTAALVATSAVALATPASASIPESSAADRAAAQTVRTPWTTEAGTDMSGYRMSAYTGKNYDPDFEQFRLCIVQREGGGQYGVVSGSGYLGAYQFGSGWASVIIDRISAEMIDAYGQAAKTELARISQLPINKWPRYWQDAGFWAVFAKGAGASNWAGGNWYCNPHRGAESGWPNPSRWNYSPLERNKPGSPTTPGTEPSAPNFGTAAFSQKLARTVCINKYRWDAIEQRALKQMWQHESNWQYKAINKQGPWYGLGQINGDFIASQGLSIKQYMSSPYQQVRVGLAYIKQRYGTPSKAWAFWQANGWY